MQTNCFPIYSKMGQTIGNPMPESTLSPSQELWISPLVCEYAYILTKMPSFVYPEVFRNLHRTRLSRRRMIWLLPHPPPSPVTVVRKHDWWHTGRLRKRDNFMTRGGGCRKSQKIRRLESLVLYKYFNTICVYPLCLRWAIYIFNVRQRIFLLRIRLSWGRMIRLFARPLPPSPISHLSLFLSLPVLYVAGWAYWR
jgi:hypothetical protein